MEITRVDFDVTCITITCVNDIIKLYAIGDCCSYSYFHDSCEEQFRRLVGSKFIGMKYSYEIIDQSTSFSCTRIATYYVNTSVGKIPLVLINESNGYYGGWIDMHINGKNESDKIE